MLFTTANQCDRSIFKLTRTDSITRPLKVITLAILSLLSLCAVAWFALNYYLQYQIESRLSEHGESLAQLIAATHPDIDDIDESYLVASAERLIAANQNITAISFHDSSGKRLNPAPAVVSPAGDSNLENSPSDDDSAAATEPDSPETTDIKADISDLKLKKPAPSSRQFVAQLRSEGERSGFVIVTLETTGLAQSLQEFGRWIEIALAVLTVGALALMLLPIFLTRSFSRHTEEYAGADTVQSELESFDEYVDPGDRRNQPTLFSQSLSSISRFLRRRNDLEASRIRFSSPVISDSQIAEEQLTHQISDIEKASILYIDTGAQNANRSRQDLRRYLRILRMVCRRFGGQLMPGSGSQVTIAFSNPSAQNRHGQALNCALVLSNLFERHKLEARLLLLSPEETASLFQLDDLEGDGWRQQQLPMHYFPQDKYEISLSEKILECGNIERMVEVKQNSLTLEITEEIFVRLRQVSSVSKPLDKVIARQVDYYQQILFKLQLDNE